MRVGINPQFVRPWYDRAVERVLLRESVLLSFDQQTFYGTSYVVPDGRFALGLSLSMSARLGYIGGRVRGFEVYLQLLPAGETRWLDIWQWQGRLHDRFEHANVTWGEYGFFREGDRLRWYLYMPGQRCVVQVFVVYWLAVFSAAY